LRDCTTPPVISRMTATMAMIATRMFMISPSGSVSRTVDGSHRIGEASEAHVTTRVPDVTAALVPRARA
jgi:hypothetical protein